MEFGQKLGKIFTDKIHYSRVSSRKALGFSLALALASTACGYIGSDGRLQPPGSIASDTELENFSIPDTPLIDCLPGEGSGPPIYSEAEQAAVLIKIEKFGNFLRRVINREGIIKGYYPVGDAKILDVTNIDQIDQADQRRLLFNANPHRLQNEWDMTFYNPINPLERWMLFRSWTWDRDCGGPLSFAVLNGNVHPEEVREYLGNNAVDSENAILPDKLKEVLEGVINLPENTRWQRGFQMEVPMEWKPPKQPFQREQTPAIQAKGTYPDNSKVEIILSSSGRLRLVYQGN